MTFKRCPANNSCLPGLLGHVDLYVRKEVIRSMNVHTNKKNKKSQPAHPAPRPISKEMCFIFVSVVYWIFFFFCD